MQKVININEQKLCNEFQQFLQLDTSVEYSYAMLIWNDHDDISDNETTNINEIIAELDDGKYYPSVYSLETNEYTILICLQDIADLCAFKLQCSNIYSCTLIDAVESAMESYVSNRLSFTEFEDDFNNMGDELKRQALYAMYSYTQM